MNHSYALINLDVSKYWKYWYFFSSRNPNSLYAVVLTFLPNLVTVTALRNDFKYMSEVGADNCPGTKFSADVHIYLDII
jgi:hypothetical protein